MAERGAMRAELSREDSSERGPPVSWDNFSHWVCCVCVVTFDLELGQALEVRIECGRVYVPTDKSLWTQLQKILVSELTPLASEAKGATLRVVLSII